MGGCQAFCSWQRKPQRERERGEDVTTRECAAGARTKRKQMARVGRVEGVRVGVGGSANCAVDKG